MMNSIAKFCYPRRLAAICVSLSLSLSLSAATSISQFGITWSFNGDYPVGQYANGDYYVVAPSNLTIVSILPLSSVLAGRTINGSMINPIAGGSAKQGFDSYSSTFQSSLNVARPNGSTISLVNPLLVAPGSSLISTESDLTATGGNRPTSLNAAILTVVSSAPPAGTFRPPYCGTSKPLWNKSSLNYNILASLPPVATTPSLASCASNFQRPWIEIVTSYQGREIHPINNQPDYGREMAYETGEASLRLQLNDTNAAKETLMVRLVQYGIDIYGAAINGAIWYSAGGHNQGRKMPMLLAGLALNDSNILAWADAARHNIFQDDQQYFYVDDSIQTEYINHTDYPDKYRTDYQPRTANVTISNSSPAVITWPTTSAIVSISNSSPAVVSWSGHGLYIGQAFKFSSTGSLPTGITAGVTYYTIPAGMSANNFQFSASMNGSPINTSSSGSGTQTATKGHGLGVMQPIKFTTTGSLPAPFVASQTYWILSSGLTVDTFCVSSVGTYDGVAESSPVNTSTLGSGIQTASFNLAGLPDWGEQHLGWNDRDGSNWNSQYRNIVDTSVMPSILAARLTVGGMNAWNWSPVFDYMDRAILINPNAHTGASNELTTFSKQMWNAYRGSPSAPPITSAPSAGATPPTHAIININQFDSSAATSSANPTFGAVDTSGVATGITSTVSIRLVNGMNTGERVVLAYSSEGGDPVSSVTDSVGNVYSLIKTQAPYNDSSSFTNIYSANVTSTLTPGATITVSLSGSHYITKSWFVCKLTGCSTSNQPNQTVGNSVYASSVTASASPTSAPTVLFGIVKARTTETYSGSSWTNIGSQDCGTSRFWYLTKTATGTTPQDIGGILSGNQVYFATWVGFN